jgi:hypothetical protein
MTSRITILSLLLTHPALAEMPRGLPISEQKTRSAVSWTISPDKQTGEYRTPLVTILSAPSYPKKGEVKLICEPQSLEGTVTRRGLAVRPLDESLNSWVRIEAVALVRPNVTTLCLESEGVVSKFEGRVVLKKTGFHEEYTVSKNGIRQDFIVEQRPPGHGELELRLMVNGARSVQTDKGLRLIGSVGDGEIDYTRLHVTDATGQVLPARMVLADGQPHSASIFVADDGAAYPIRIDPTYGAANWNPIGIENIQVNHDRVSYIAAGTGTLFVSFGTNLAKKNKTGWQLLSNKAGGPLILVADKSLYTLDSRRLNLLDGNELKFYGSSFSGEVYSLARFKDPKTSVESIYFGGSFEKAYSLAGVAGSPFLFLGPEKQITANGVAGRGWPPKKLGDGFQQGIVRALAADSDGNLYAGGSISSGGIRFVAKWNGSNWSPLGLGLGDHMQSYVDVYALAVDATGNLYVGGEFTKAGGGSARNIAKWNGSSWSPLGSGTNGPVRAIAVDRMGNIYAGGDFTVAGGVSASKIAKWDGNAWTSLGAGIGPTASSSVRCLALMGNSLYVGGEFATAGGRASRNVAEFREVPFPRNTDLSISNQYGLKVAGRRVILRSPRITNRSDIASDRIRVALFASRKPDIASATLLARKDLGQLAPGRTKSSQSHRIRYNGPRMNGKRHLVTAVQEISGGRWLAKGYASNGVYGFKNGKIGRRIGGPRGGSSGPGGDSNPWRFYGTSTQKSYGGYVRMGSSEMRSYPDGWAYDIQLLVPGTWPVSGGWGATPGRAHAGDWMRQYGRNVNDVRSLLRTSYSVSAEWTKPHIAWRRYRVSDGQTIYMGYEWLWSATSSYVGKLPSEQWRPPLPAGWQRWDLGNTRPYFVEPEPF